MTSVFLNSFLQTSAGLSCVVKVTIFYWTEQFVDKALFKVCWDFVFGVHNNGFKGFGSFEDDLYTGMLKDSYEFLTEARDIWNRDEHIFIDF